MNDQRWLEETDPIRLMLKLNEEVGEIVHAFNRRKLEDTLNEIRDTHLILARLKVVITEVGIPDTLQPERYRKEVPSGKT